MSFDARKARAGIICRFDTFFQVLMRLKGLTMDQLLMSYGRAYVGVATGRHTYAIGYCGFFRTSSLLYREPAGAYLGTYNSESRRSTSTEPRRWYFSACILLAVSAAVTLLVGCGILKPLRRSAAALCLTGLWGEYHPKIEQSYRLVVLG